MIGAVVHDENPTDKQPQPIKFIKFLLFTFVNIYNIKVIMATIKRKSISFFAKLRNYFITGIVVLVPIGITLYLTKFFISISSKIIPNEINPNNYLPISVPGLEILLSDFPIETRLVFEKRSSTEDQAA